MKFRYLATAIVLTALSPVAISATDGTLGATSTGETDVTITIGDVVQVLVEGNVPLTYTPGVNSTGGTTVCIYRNSNANVNVTLSSGNENAGVFRMNDGGTNFLPYSVDFTGSTTALTNVVSSAINAISDEDNASSNCGGAPYSHSLDVTASSTDLDAAPAGSYLDTLTILAAPI